MFHIVLFEPEIPPNTGNIIRLASNTGCQLHLIEPLGFDFSDKSLRRAGLDYHQFSTVKRYKDWDEFIGKTQPERIFALSTKGRKNYAEENFNAGDYFLFGPETRGLPEEVRESNLVNAVLRLPMQDNSRSLNLSNSVAIVIYEAWRQTGFAMANPDTNTD